MKDLQKAGLNPMLAISNAPPNVPQPNFPNMGEAAETAIKAYSAKQQSRLTEAQIGVATATESKTVQEADKAEAETKILQNSALHGAKGAELSLAQIESGLEKTRAEIKNLDLSGQLSSQQIAQNKDLMPLLEDAQRLANQAVAAGMPEKQAEAAYWRAVGAAGVTLQKAMDLIPTGLLPEIVRKKMKR